MNSCGCPFCNIKEEEILCKTENFFVTPGIGWFVEGYVLICHKKHYIGFGEIPVDQMQEFRTLQEKVRNVLAETYTSPLFFEHGAVSNTKKWSCCVEHAHMHVWPVDKEILPELKEEFAMRELENDSAFSKHFNTWISYYYYENKDGKKFICEVNLKNAPSQYLRMLLAEKIGKGDKWNRKIHKFQENFEKTFLVIKNKLA